MKEVDIEAGAGILGLGCLAALALLIYIVVTVLVH
jgi:hypothetical protein